jgi:hypothetical protein
MKCSLKEMFIMNEKEGNEKEVNLSQNSTPNKSRRSFLKGSIAVAGAGVAVSGMSGSASAQSYPKLPPRHRQMRYCLLENYDGSYWELNSAIS